MAIITASGLTKEYQLKNGKKTALSGISFSVEPGEAVGIIGKNGSGKSSLLKIISGITAATAGTVQTAGSVAALLELGAGFHPEYTGIENIYLNGTLRGKSKHQVREKLPEILDFAQIGGFAEQKVKTYSSGMFLRLAFATAVAFRPDILLVDEALSVGDILFQAKCFQKLKELQKDGVTILYVTHDIDSVRRFCRRAIWLEDGKICLDGEVESVTAAYMAASIGQGETLQGRRFGACVGAIRSITAPRLWEHGEEIRLTVEVLLPKGEKGANLSVSVKNREGLDLLVLSSREAGITIGGGTLQRVEFCFQNPLCGGSFVLSAGLEIPGSVPIRYYDYWDGALEIKGGETPYFGIVHIPVEVKTDEESQSKHYPVGGSTE